MTAAAEGRLMVGFEGYEVPDWLPTADPEARPGGFLLGRHWNLRDEAQIRRLTAALQDLAPDGLPFLIAADEEGGQLSALVGMATPFPGNMALAATDDEELARVVAEATALELRALGFNTVLAPVVDVASNPANPSLGIRSFGSDPELVARFGAAMVSGYRAGGIACAAKHFPGKGEATLDPHDDLPRLDFDRTRFDEVERPPFAAAIASGVDLLMVGHYAVPALTGDAVTPLSVHPSLADLTRDDLGFAGVVVSDALDMGAFTSAGDLSGLVGAGVDLLLCTRDRAHHRRAAAAVAAGDAPRHAASLARINALRASLPREPIPAETLNAPLHRRLARTAAHRAVTLVRAGGAVPLRDAGSLLVVMPAPSDLTPADTSSLVPPGLADAFRLHHGNVTEVVTTIEPSNAEITAVLNAASDHDAVVIGTIVADVHERQARLVRALAKEHPRLVTVALRTPFDLTAYPSARTHFCTYSILPPSLDALAAVVVNGGATEGRLPAPIPGLYEVGHGLESTDG